MTSPTHPLTDRRLAPFDQQLPSSPPLASPRLAPEPTAGTEEPMPPPKRRRRAWKVVLRIVAVILLVLGGVTYWALNRYVIDHVEIDDVAAYEAQVAGGSPGKAGSSTTTADAEGAAAVDADANSSEAVVTADTYTSDAMSITISKVVTGSGKDQVVYFVADVTVADGTSLRGGFADNKFGENIIASTSAIAEFNDAVFAINGDYYGYRDSGIVIRNGVLYRDVGARQGLAIYADGTMEVYDETTTNGEQLLADGVWNTLSFGPALVDGGEVVDGIEDVEVDTNFGNHSIQGEQPRTGIGLIEANHFVFVVADGRADGYSRGVTMTEFAEIFDGLGAQVAYNLDGGGSSTMVFNGALVNDPLGRGEERGTSDILYLA